MAQGFRIVSIFAAGVAGGVANIGLADKRIIENEGIIGISDKVGLVNPQI